MKSLHNEGIAHQFVLLIFIVLFGVLGVGYMVASHASPITGAISVKLTKRSTVPGHRPKADIYVATSNPDARCTVNGKKLPRGRSRDLSVDKSGEPARFYYQFEARTTKKGTRTLKCTPGSYLIGIQPVGRYHAANSNYRSITVHPREQTKVELEVYKNEPAPDKNNAKKFVNKFIKLINKTKLEERKKAISLMTPALIKDTNNYCNGDPQCHISSDPLKQYKLRGYSDNGFTLISQETNDRSAWILYAVITGPNGNLLIDGVEDWRY